MKRAKAKGVRIGGPRSSAPYVHAKLQAIHHEHGAV
jgi:hypothetical protein